MFFDAQEVFVSENDCRIPGGRGHGMK